MGTDCLVVCPVCLEALLLKTNNKTGVNGGKKFNNVITSSTICLMSTLLIVFTFGSWVAGENKDIEIRTWA